VKRCAAVLAVLLAILPARAQTPAHELARRIAEAGLDPEECYQVRGLRFSREDIRVYLTEGYIIFGKEVNGARLSAVFSGDIEGGDAELLLLPPYQSERLSLAAFARSPNLDEHFRSAVFVFTDDTYAELMKLLNLRGAPRRRPDRGALLAQTMDPVIRNLSGSFSIRVVRDLLSESRPENGFFYGAIAGQTVGNLDVLYDPRSSEQISVGQVAVRSDRAYFNLWTCFRGRSFRSGRRSAPQEDVVIRDYRIDARLDPELRMEVRTAATIVPGPDSRRALAFDISPQMRVSEARVDGEPAEVFQPDSLRSGLIRGDINETFLVVPARPLEPGREHRIEFQHSGSVITDAGNGVYFVGARGSWYPNRPSQFARYDLTFHYPRELDLVAAGRAVEQSTEGDWQTVRHRIDTPVRLAGFNLGRFEHYAVTRGGYTVDVYANRRVEAALEPPRVVVLQPTDLPGTRRWTVDLAPFPIEPPKIKPAEHLEQLALEITGELEFMASHFGPPVLKMLTVAPIPGTFGQGFPGLIYLSTLAYLDPRRRPRDAQSDMQQLFYSEILHAHETAHQWWGNVVASAGPEDEWIMEALANYSALLYLEKRKGGNVLDQVLSSYRTRLLTKNESGHTVDSAGPIIWGHRLETSQTPQAWQMITYEKGSWIMHMLRRRLGDERFLAMLGELRSRYQYRSLSTEEFRRAAAGSLPPRSFDPTLESFFEQWVYSTGIPSLKLAHSVRGKAPQVRLTGTVTQSDVAGDFSTWVPVEIQLPRGKPIVQWVRTSSEPTTFTVLLKQAPSRVSLDPNNSVLRR
jgi:hypothetical protein